MWLVRQLARLVLQIAALTAATVVLALILAALSAGSFHADARILGIVFGCMLLAMGGVGRNSNVERFADRGVMQQAWGTIPGFDALQSRADEPQLAFGAALFLSGVALVALALTVL